MQITFHLGAHQTDDDRLMRSLMRNNQKLSEQGIYIPGPSKFRTMLRDVTPRLAGAPADEETQDMVLDAILDGTEATHIVLSDSSFICRPEAILAEGGYYAKAGYKSSWLRNCLPDHEVRFAIGIRNPATHVPAVFEATKGDSFGAFLGLVEPRDIRWSDAIADIVAENPGCPVIAWCNEDTPLIWPEVMRQVADHDADTRLKGGFDVLSRIMEQEGLRRLRAYLGEHPPETEDQRRQIIGAFLDKYAMDEEIDEVILVPGWDDALIAAMTEDYEADILRIRQMPGVHFIEG